MRERGTDAGKRMRIWSAACARATAGDDRLLHRRALPNPQWKISILGTDIARSLEQAKTAVRGAVDTIGPENYARRFFTKAKTPRSGRPTVLTSMISYRQHNDGTVAGTPFDLVFSRT